MGLIDPLDAVFQRGLRFVQGGFVQLLEVDAGDPVGVEGVYDRLTCALAHGRDGGDASLRRCRAPPLAQPGLTGDYHEQHSGGGDSAVLQRHRAVEATRQVRVQQPRHEEEREE